MTEYIYKLRTDEIPDEENQKYTVYGVDIFYKNQIIESIPDIFFDKEKSEEFVDFCNNIKLSILHLMHAIDDAMA